MYRLVLTVLLLYPFSTFATCVLNTSNTSMLQQEQTVQIPLIHQMISVGEDMPVGSEIYRQTYRSGLSTYKVTCASSSGYFRINRQLVYTPMPISGYTGGTYTTVYETGIPGIGISIWNGAKTMFPNETITCSGSDGINCTVSDPYSVNAFDITLIKTGDITPGLLDASSLPTVSISLGKQTENYVKIATYSFIGSIQVNTSTCTTPDYTVPLGNWPQARFKSKGSASPWVPASIILTNCTKAVGNKPTGGNVWSENASNIITGVLTSNTWTVSFSSVSGVIDADNGIISTDTSATDAAQGIGIQLSQGLPDSAGTNLVKIGDSAMTGTLPTTGETSYVIPLSARIIQTEDAVVAGNVTGKVVYTLNYL
ncbi:TPA: fimbrial protein [Enterobacter cloacae]